ncbi:MAG TPA: hypothetical protein VNT75_06355 [Symbiobacteriaceae bacterium]|nr:hypothetical protein [Symbiobacteriaceae bacterium]
MPTIMALFQLPELAEEAVAELSLNGFTANDVALVLFSALPEAKPRGLMGWLSRGGIFGDTIDRSDGVSVMDGICVGAVFAGILGLAWGAKTALGPVTVGTLAMLGGGIVGFIVDRLIPEKRRDLYELARIPGVVLVEVTAAATEQAETAHILLKRHQPKQIAILADSRRWSRGEKPGCST